MSAIAIQSSGSGAGTLSIAAPITATNRTLTLPDATTTLVGTDATQTLTNKTIQGGAITSGTAVASTSGTAIDFTSIPSWVKRITVMYSGVSTNGTSAVQVQLGTSGGIQATGYNAASALALAVNTVTTSAVTTGFCEASGAAAVVRHGSAILSLLDSSTGLWSMMYNVGTTDTQRVFLVYGTKTLSGTLDRVRITTVNGTDTFDAGSINILYEG
jgi:hypothetical protein